MSNVRVVKAYRKGDNAVFKLESVNGNPLNPIRTCFVTKPIACLDKEFEAYIGTSFPGRIVFDESVQLKPKNTFQLVKRTMEDDQVTHYEVLDSDGNFTGYLSRWWRYTSSDRKDYLIDRELFRIVPRTMSKNAWKKEFETGHRVKEGDLI